MRATRTWLIGGLLACLPAASATAQVDLVAQVELIKGVDRDDGAIRPPDEEPYFIEICVRGFVAEDPVGTATVQPPTFFAPAVIPLPECWEFTADNPQDLDNAFPSDGLQPYQFTFSKGGSFTSMSVSYVAPAPQGFADVVSPPDGSADVDPDTDLTLSWSIEASGCAPSGSIEDCADGVQVFVVDPAPPGVDVFESPDLPIETTQETVPADVLEPLTPYDVELETFTGDLDLPMSTSSGDEVRVKAIYKDINNTAFVTTVPEPGSAVLGLVALGAAGWLARRRPRA